MLGIAKEISALIDEEQSDIDKTLLTLLLSLLAEQAYIDEYRYRDIVKKVFSEEGLTDERFRRINQYFMDNAGMSDIRKSTM